TVERQVASCRLPVARKELEDLNRKTVERQVASFLLPVARKELEDLNRKTVERQVASFLLPVARENRGVKNLNKGRYMETIFHGGWPYK
ncbi:MAG: hypothetical protein OEW48_17705, partial [Phycisphaerae bacterium]|nr:hypothetical protein [Phycisphaerae bacterium]